MIKKATVRHVSQIQALINEFAREDQMLPRSRNELYEHIRDYWVAVDRGRVIGCAALHLSWDDLAEVKSVAVSVKKQGRGVGSQLVNACLKEAKQLGVRRLFVLTYRPAYFRRFGFRVVKHEALPHKVWAECINCAKFPDCKEIAMMKRI